MSEGDGAPAAGSATGPRPSSATSGPARASVLRSTLRSFVVKDMLMTVVALAVGCALWQGAALLVDQPWLPPWTEVQARILVLMSDPEFAATVSSSIRDMIVGYAVSVVIGVSVGLGMGFSQLFDNATRVYVDFLLFIPPVITTPIFLSIFGLSRTALLALIVLFAAPIIAITVRAAVASIDRELVETGLAFGASKRQILRLVALRSAMPGVFTGLHLGMGRAVKGMIIGQLILAVFGLGAYEAQFQRSFDAAGLWCIAVIVIVIAILFSWLVLLGDRIANSWAYVGNR